jgi:hypothetical protein
VSVDTDKQIAERRVLLQYMETFSAFGHTSAAHRPAWKFNSIEEAVLHYGRWWIPQRRPRQWSNKFAYKACFENATRVLLEARWRKGLDLYYVEGYAVGASGFPVHHAWVVDADGRVIDRTWTQNDVAGGSYFGIPFDGGWYTAHLVATHCYGVFGGDYKACARLIKEGLPEDAIAEPWRKELIG